MKSKGTILVVDDDPDVLTMLHEELDEAGFHVVTAPSAREALRQTDLHGTDVIVTDLVMPEMKGDELLHELRTHAPGVPVVIMTAFGTIESAVVAMRDGAYHYLTKPFAVDQLVLTIENALVESRLRHELAEATRPLAEHHGIVADSAAMRRVLALVERSGPANAPVLIIGESGTGKELVARALHASSPRRDRPFVSINCSALPEPLLERQLFGDRRGVPGKEEGRGLFLEAEGGTLLLDEVGDLEPALQAKLLQALQERTVHPLGAPAPVPVDVRVIAATHRNLEALTVERRFRQDLFYRLNVITIHIPPLRERTEDLVPLVAHFIAKHARRIGREAPTVSLTAMELFRRYAWPGNVRELENTIERALVLGSGPLIHLEDLPDDLRHKLRDAPGPESIMLLADMEREQIVRALKAAHGNKAAAARLLGIDRKTLYRKLDLYGVRPA